MVHENRIFFDQRFKEAAHPGYPTFPGHPGYVPYPSFAGAVSIPSFCNDVDFLKNDN